MRFQEVAIKKMTATKTKEFMAEMKVLCKVHHTNLVMLICLPFLALFFQYKTNVLCNRLLTRFNFLFFQR